MEPLNEFKKYLNENTTEENNPFINIFHNIIFDAQTRDGDTLPQMIDSYIIDKYFKGNQEEYEYRDGFDQRNQILHELIPDNLGIKLLELIQSQFEEK